MWYDVDPRVAQEQDGEAARELLKTDPQER
jgi:hypothetical protein